MTTVISVILPCGMRAPCPLPVRYRSLRLRATGDAGSLRQLAKRSAHVSVCTERVPRERESSVSAWGCALHPHKHRTCWQTNVVDPGSGAG